MSCWKILETERRSWKFSLASGNSSLELNGLEMHEKCAFLSLVSCVVETFDTIDNLVENGEAKCWKIL